MTTELRAIAIKSQQHPKHRFQNLYGLLNSKLLYNSWGALNKQSAPGIDGVTLDQYQRGLRDNIQRLDQQLKHKQYRAADIKRVYIPKANGKQRPLGLPTVDDKLVQQALSQILQSIWESEFVTASYGYRPNKSAHQAVESLQFNLRFKGYAYVVEADIKGFFDHMSHAWLMRMLALRIDDSALLGLIGQWLKSRVLEPEGHYVKPTSGTPQGGVISPVLANIYLHYVLDLWFEKVVKPRCEGRAMLVRYADDFVVAFRYKSDAQAFYEALPGRLAQFDLSLAPEKTRLQRFTRFQPGRQSRFEFLGFELYWEARPNGEPTLRRRTAPKKQRSAMSEFYRWIKYNRSRRLSDFMAELRRKLQGFQNYFGLPDNSRSLARLFYHVVQSLYKWLNRRSQRRSYTWPALTAVLNYCRIRRLRVSKRPIVIDWY